MKYLKQFIIGSSYLVFAPHFYAVQNSQVKTYGYYEYTMLAPIWLGMWNVISLILAEHFKLTMRKRFLLVSVLASISIMIIATFLKTYDLSPAEWLKYYILIFLKYLFIWNIIVYNIEKNI